MEVLTERVNPRALSFAEWLEVGHKMVPGTIQQPYGPGKMGYIAPDNYPAARFFFSYDDWPTWKQKEIYQGRKVWFDHAPLDYNARCNPPASNVRFR